MESIYSYISYRKYLHDFYIFKKATEEHYSYRLFSQKAGVKLINFLPWLISGKRNLSGKTVPSVISALELFPEEGEYFSLLVDFDQTKVLQEREALWEEILLIRDQQEIHTNEELRYNFFSNWKTIAIRNILNVIPYNPRKEGYYKLGAMLNPRISKREARQSVLTLLELGLIKQDSDGVLVNTEMKITVGEAAPDFHLKEYHREMIGKALNTIEKSYSENQEISAITTSVSKKSIEKIQHAIQVFRNEVAHIVSVDSSPEELIQINLQLFPLAHLAKPIKDR